MRFSDFKILTKVLVVVAVMAAIMAAISVISVNGLAELSADTGEVEIAGQEALTGARVNQNVIALNRAEFRAAATGIRSKPSAPARGRSRRSARFPEG